MEFDLSPSELAALELLITSLEEQGVSLDEVVPAVTPVAGVVVRATLAAAAGCVARGICLTDSPPAEEQISSFIKNVEESMPDVGTTTLKDLLAIRAAAHKARYDRRN